MKIPPAFLLLIILRAWMPVHGQLVPPGAPVPPGYGSSAPTIHLPTTDARRPVPPLDPAVLRRDAKELLDLSQSLQIDVESINRGLLPKNVNEKLKRIEKLSKRLRSEIDSR